MSKLIDIKHRIMQLDGGAFQNLCDAYLHCEGYGSGYSLGMKTGTNKTAPGSPDTYFLTAENKYVMVMYSTQQTDFLKKAEEDIAKCFDQKRTGLSEDDVAEIVLCHTYGRLRSGDDKLLRDLCAKRDTKLTLIGLDKLAEGLFFEYPRLARDFLSVSVDTGQVMSISEFIQTHDNNKMSAPLDTEFLFRQEEIDAAKKKLSQSGVLIISGPAGTGKTRLALELCKSISQEQGDHVLCIRNNNLQLYEDFLGSLESGKNNLVFVDDANELSGLSLILNYLSESRSDHKCIRKIILTVRDYARRQVLETVAEFERPEILKVGIMKDEEIAKLMEKHFEIRNPLYLERITSIAEGNARLAMLAGKTAAKEDSLLAINDATELYEAYYGKQIDAIVHTETGIISAGIMAFFEGIHLEKLDVLEPLLSAVKLTKDQFVTDLKMLHEMELVDICQNRAAKMSDQSFSNYLIKRVFVDRKVLPLAQMIEVSFFISRTRTISACNVLMNVFAEDKVRRYIKDQVGIVWEHIKADPEKFPSFFKTFHMIRPTETLLYLKKAIDAESFHPFDVQSVDFKKFETEKEIRDTIISILCNFKRHEMLSSALDLLILYYQKRPDLFEQMYSAFTSRFGVDKDSYLFSYNTQQIVTDKLCLMVEENPTLQNLLLFVRIAENYLMLTFNRVESGRGDTISWYTLPLSYDEQVIIYRDRLLQELIKIYANGQCHEEIESLLMDYCRNTYNADYSIVRREIDQILSFFSMLSPDNLYHCVTAAHIEDILKLINYDHIDILSPFLNSPKYLIFDVLNNKRQKQIFKDYQERKAWEKEQVQLLVKGYDVLKYEYMFQICNECLCTIDKEARLLTSGVEYALEAIPANSTLFIDVVKKYMQADTPYCRHPHKIIERLFNIISPEQIKDLIISVNFKQQNIWMWEFYVCLPESYITPSWAEDLLHFLNRPSKTLRSAPLRPLDAIRKYEIIHKNFLLEASKIVSEHYDESPYIFYLYFEWLSCPSDVAEMVKMYRTELNLLEEIYFKLISYEGRVDEDGELLAEIISMDGSFLFSYLDFLLKQTTRFHYTYDTRLTRLAFVWQKDDYFTSMDFISNYIIEHSANSIQTSISILRYLFICKDVEEEIIKRCALWICHTIQQFSGDEQRMYILFSALEDQNENLRREALKEFLHQNSDYQLFERLPLDSSLVSGVGSLIPAIQRKIDYLRSLFPMLSGIDFLQHTQKIEKDIQRWEADIQREEIEELLRDIS